MVALFQALLNVQLLYKLILWFLLVCIGYAQWALFLTVVFLHSPHQFFFFNHIADFVQANLFEVISVVSCIFDSASDVCHSEHVLKICLF